LFRNYGKFPVHDSLGWSQRTVLLTTHGKKRWEGNSLPRFKRKSTLQVSEMRTAGTGRQGVLLGGMWSTRTWGADGGGQETGSGLLPVRQCELSCPFPSQFWSFPAPHICERWTESVLHPSLKTEGIAGTYQVGQL
jgi:hypothetical protein